MSRRSQPLVSVIIPAFDREAFLAEAVESVRAQSYRSWELIVVDDGSSDGTWPWLQRQAGILALKNDVRCGPSAARNRGAEAARGEYLAFLDSDDLFLPDKLARQVELLEADDGVALCHSNEIWLRGKQRLRQRPKHEKRGGWIFEHCLPICRISPSAAVVRKQVFEHLGGFDEELEVAEDYELWLRLTCRHPVGFIDEPLVVKRGGHAGQLSEKYGQIEKYRIQALVRVVRRAPLSPQQRELALQTLRQKCAIYARGCEKRGRLQEAREYCGLPSQLS